MSKSTEDLVGEAQEAWEATEAKCEWSSVRNSWIVELIDGKSKAISGARSICFVGKTLEAACEYAIWAAPMLSLEQLHNNAIALAEKP